MHESYLNDRKKGSIHIIESVNSQCNKILEVEYGHDKIIYSTDLILFIKGSY